MVEDDPSIRVLLQQLLEAEGHRVTVLCDGIAALGLMARQALRPDLMLADYNLPLGLSGLQLAVKLRDTYHCTVPVIILTGDISTETLRAIADHDCVELNKPVKLKELSALIQRLLPPPMAERDQPASDPAARDLGAAKPLIFVVDDNAILRGVLRGALETNDWAVKDYPSGAEFLAAYRPGGEACLLLDANLPDMNGMELLRQLKLSGDGLPVVVMTGSSDVAVAVAAMKAGAADFIEKPVGRADLLASIGRALEQARDHGKISAWHIEAARQIATLTPQQHKIMELVLAGHPSKNIAVDLGISQRTVENHRAAIMKKTGAASLPALARLALAAAGAGDIASPG